jgi:hypothetical protein
LPSGLATVKRAVMSTTWPPGGLNAPASVM